MTNPTISAEERAGLLANAAYMYFGSDDEEFLENFTKDATKQIRQAEQAAYERAAQYIADKEARAETRVIAACASLWSVELRILAREPEEVG